MILLMRVNTKVNMNPTFGLFLCEIIIISAIMQILIREFRPL